MKSSRSSGSDLRTRALAALTRKERTQSELVALLSRHAPTEECQALVAALAREGLQSDERAALSRARAALRLRRTRSRAEQELQAAGVDPATASRAVAEAYADHDDQQRLHDALQTLRGTPPALRLKAARKLIRQGFDPERVEAALQDATEDTG
ncbi:MAG: RecX family transcriptional regulator [Myxococcota bacterium]